MSFSPPAFVRQRRRSCLTAIIGACALRSNRLDENSWCASAGALQCKSLTNRWNRVDVSRAALEAAPRRMDIFTTLHFIGEALMSRSMGRISATAFVVLSTTLTIPNAARAQQLIPKTTGPQCAAWGGRILTWTNTAGRGPEVGECLIPPSGRGGGAGYQAPPSNSGANNAAAALGVASGILGVIGALNDITQDQGSGSPPAVDASSARNDDNEAPAGSVDVALATRNYERGARHNRVRRPCEAASFFARAARYFANAGDETRRQDALFQSSLSQADCEEVKRRQAGKAGAPASTIAVSGEGDLTTDQAYVFYCPDPEERFGGARYVVSGALCPSGKKPRHLPRPAAEDGDEKYVYYCPPEPGVYDLKRPGRYVRPGEGCNGRRAQRLPRPSQPQGDEKYVIYCPDEDNVSGGGRYVEAGSGCQGRKAVRVRR
jgi:hypothetical protein